MARKRVGVVLSGCGYLDGAEIQEATLTLLALDRRGAEAFALAPDDPQLDVVDHLTRQAVAGAARNVRAEAARIARGAVADLATAKGAAFDALVFPGGFGAAKNLCSFAADGARMKVNSHVERLIREMHAATKPMGFICIAPVLAAKVLGEWRPTLTIGDDAETAAALEAMGARHQARKVDEIAIDPGLKLVSTPAYMLGPSIAKVAAGIEKLVFAVLDLA